jgi:diacylglycerol kinase (ATP)
VAGTRVPLGIVAAGTGNDLARSLRLPVGDPRAAAVTVCAALDAGDSGIRHVDAVRVTHPRPGPPPRWVAGAVSAGLDAVVNARANAMRRPRGAARYALAAALEIVRYRPWSYRLTFDEVVDVTGGPTDRSWPVPPAGSPAMSWTGRAALVTAASAPRIGGGIRVAPGARLDDGYLDVVVATDLTRPGAGAAFPLMLAGAHLRHPKVHVVRARSVRIEPGTTGGGARAPRLPAAFGDGEHLGPPPLTATAHAGALRVLTPPR